MPPKDTYTIAQNFSFREYVNFTFYQLLQTKGIRRLAIYTTAIGFLGGLFELFVLGRNKAPDLGLAAAFFLPLAVLIVFLLVFVPLACIFILRFRPQIIRGITYRFTHWGMERIGTKTEATIPWRDFKKLKETKSFFLLTVQEMVKENKVKNIHVIQKRMFVNSEETRDFVIFLDTNVPL